MADSLTVHDLLQCAQKWLTFLTPFFKASERSQAGCQHRLFFAQVEYCDNLIFRRRAALDQLGERLLDVNRTIGQPVALVVLRNKAIKPLLAAAQRLRKSRGPQNPRAIDKHYETIRAAMQGVFAELGLAT